MGMYKKIIWLTLKDASGLDMRDFTAGRRYALAKFTGNLVCVVNNRGGRSMPMSGLRFGLVPLEQKELDHKTKKPYDYCP